MWILSGLVMAAFFAGEVEAGKFSRDECMRPNAVIQSDFGSGDVRIARKRVQSKKKRPRARTVRKRKPAPRPTPRPAPAPASQSGEMNVPLGSSLGRTTRVEFDAQLIKGQTTKAGEVQILERKDVALQSMVKRRTSFREEIIQTVFPDK